MILIPSTKLGGMNGFILLTAPSEKAGLLSVSLLSSLSALLLFSGLSPGCEGLPGGVCFHLTMLTQIHNCSRKIRIRRSSVCVCVC